MLQTSFIIGIVFRPQLFPQNNSNAQGKNMLKTMFHRQNLLVSLTVAAVLWGAFLYLKKCIAVFRKLICINLISVLYFDILERKIFIYTYLLLCCGLSTMSNISIFEEKTHKYFIINTLKFKRSLILLLNLLYIVCSVIYKAISFIAY